MSAESASAEQDRALAGRERAPAWIHLDAYRKLDELVRQGPVTVQRLYEELRDAGGMKHPPDAIELTPGQFISAIMRMGRCGWITMQKAAEPMRLDQEEERPTLDDALATLQKHGWMSSEMLEPQTVAAAAAAASASTKQETAEAAVQLLWDAGCTLSPSSNLEWKEHVMLLRDREQKRAVQAVTEELLDVKAWGERLDELSKADGEGERVCRHLKKIGYRPRVSKEHTRALIDAPCGFGKTVVGFKICKELWDRLGDGLGTVVVFEPRLGLITQAIDEWTEWAAKEEKGPKLDISIVCSLTVPRNVDDAEAEKELRASLHNTDSSTDTRKAWKAPAGCKSLNEAAVQAKLAEEPQTGVIRVLFACYDSAKHLREAYDDPGAAVPPIGFAIFDEAHTTAVETDNSDGHQLALFDSNVPVKRRLFMTATTKVHKLTGKRASSEDNLAASMSHGEVYGSVMHDGVACGARYSLRFDEAIEKGLITDYKLLVISVASNEARQALKKLAGSKLQGRNGLEAWRRKNENEEIAAIEVAKVKALQHALKMRGLSKAFVFNSRKKYADLMGELTAEFIDELEDKRHVVHSGIKSDEIFSTLERFKKVTGKAVLSNVRSMSTGTNVPAADLAMFATSKGDTLDTVQSAGRVMRLDLPNEQRPGNKLKVAHILLCVFDDDPEDDNAPGSTQGETQAGARPKDELVKTAPEADERPATDRRDDGSDRSSATPSSASRSSPMRIDGAVNATIQDNAPEGNIPQPATHHEVQTPASGKPKQGQMPASDKPKQQAPMRAKRSGGGGGDERSVMNVLKAFQGIDRRLDTLVTESHRVSVLVNGYKRTLSSTEQLQHREALARLGERFEVMMVSVDEAKSMADFVTKVIDLCATSCTVDQALDRIEEEVLAHPSGWFIPQSLELASDWNARWQAGRWLWNARNKEREMTEEQKRRFDKLPFGEVPTEEKLKLLEDHYEQERQKDPNWSFRNNTKISARWDPDWKAGSYMGKMQIKPDGRNRECKRRRKQLSPDQQRRFDKLPYGRKGPNQEEKLARVEEEVKSHMGKDKRYRINLSKFTLKVDWQEAPWKAGSWLNKHKVDAERHNKLSPEQQTRISKLPLPLLKGAKCTFEEALHRLEGEIQKQRCTNPQWRFSQDTVIEADWNEKWRAGSWINQSRDRAMSESERARFDKIISTAYGSDVDVDDALDALEAHCKQERARNADFWIKQDLKLNTDWKKDWAAGRWMCTSQELTEQQKSRKEALPYGDEHGRKREISADQALPVLEAEVRNHVADSKQWRFPEDLELKAPWDPKWKAGKWVRNHLGNSRQARDARERMDGSLRARLEKLPFGQFGRRFTDNDKLSRLEEEVQKRESGWRIKYGLKLETEWDRQWQAYAWVEWRRKAEGTTMAAEMRERLLKLPFGSPSKYTVDDVLDLIEAEVRKQGATWRLKQLTRLEAPWDSEFKAGTWYCNTKNRKKGDGCEGLQLTPKQQERFDKVPFNVNNTIDIDKALDRLEEEVRKQKELQEGSEPWRIKAKDELDAPWDHNWKAGSWMYRYRKDSSKWSKMTSRQKARYDALPYQRRGANRRTARRRSEEGEADAQDDGVDPTAEEEGQAESVAPAIGAEGGVTQKRKRKQTDGCKQQQLASKGASDEEEGVVVALPEEASHAKKNKKKDKVRLFYRSTGSQLTAGPPRCRTEREEGQEAQAPESHRRHRPRFSGFRRRRTSDGRAGA
eukprot:COSAG04_NODE_936_length_9333_cov_16.898635_1_plen_1721_part_00